MTLLNADLSPLLALLDLMDFSGRKPAVVIDDQDSLDLSAATVAFDFNATSTQNMQGLFSRDAMSSQGDGQHVSVFIRDGDLFARFQTKTEQVVLEGGPIQANTTHSVAFSFGDGNVQLVVDGAETDSAALDFTWETSPEPIQLGALGWYADTGTRGYSNVLNGEISNFVIYDTALTDTDLENLGTPPASDTPVTETPVGDDTPGSDSGADAPPLPGPIYAASGSISIANADDVVTLPDDDTLDTDAATIAFGFTAEATKKTQGLFSRDAMNTRGDGNHLTVYLSGHEVHARFQTKEGEVTLSSDKIEAGEAYRVAVTFGDGTVSLWLDGEEVESAPLDLTWETSPEAAQIGAPGWLSDTGEDDFDARRLFKGEITDFAIYGDVLSTAQIASLPADGATVVPAAPAPVQEEPVAEEPVAEEPVAEEPVAEEPVAEEPVAEEPVAEEPVAEEPVAEEPVAEEPVAEEPVAEEPVAEEPVAEEPVAEEPVAEEPVAEEPVAEEPAEPAPLPVPVLALDAAQSVSGSGDVITIAPQSALSLDAATVAFEFKTNNAAVLQGLFSRDAMGYQGNGQHVTAYVQDGGLYVRFQNGDSTTLSFDGITSGTSHDVAVSFGDGEIALWVDGAKADSAAFDFTWQNSPEVLQLGATGWTSGSGAEGHGNALNGEISEFAIFDSALSDAQITALAEGAETAAPTITVEAAAETPAPAPAPAPAPTPTEPVVETPAPANPPANFDETPLNGFNPDDTADDGVTQDWNGDTDIEHGTVLTAGEGRLEVMGGRLSTLGHDGNVASIEILDKPAFGNVTVNPDNTMALMLSTTGQTGQTSFDYKVTYADGSSETVTQALNVTPSAQADGWGKGDHYMLEEGSDGNIIVEHGENHRKVYISDSNDALSLSDIAALEGVPVKDITGNWLAANPEYGADPSMALKADAGMKLWDAITGEYQRNSNWLLFERGYEYSQEDLGDIIDRDTYGESELHPVYVGAWGEGDKPVLDTRLEMFGGASENLVFQGLHLKGGALILRDNNNMLFDDLIVTEQGFVVQWADNLTIRNSDLFDIQKDVPEKGASNWTNEHDNRTQGIFVQDTGGVLLEDLFVHQAGWADDHKTDLGGDGGQPPSIFSHNFYLDWNNTDVTLRDTISSQPSSFGAQIRSGGFVENVVVLDGSAGLIAHGGDYRGAGPVGNYTLFLNNLITDAGAKANDGKTGGQTMAFVNEATLTSFVNNIVTHLDDPNSSADDYDATWTEDPFKQKGDVYTDDTIIYNWNAKVDPGENPDQNIDGLDTNVLDATTIQNFAAAYMNQSAASIGEFSDYLISISNGDVNAAMAKATDILEYFGAAFGTYDTPDDTPTTLRFVPDDRGDGFRWDNPLNWDAEEDPTDGDSIDLAGNWVEFDGTITLEDLDFGDGGELYVGGGRLNVAGTTATEGEGGDIDIYGTGQVWLDGYSDSNKLEVEVEDYGRFANTGKFSGLFDLVAKSGQTLLGVDTAEMEIGDGSKITVDGSKAEIGFDGANGGVSVVEMQTGGTLEMVADSGGLATIEEFRSGNLGDAPDVLSAFDMGEGTLLLDITALAGRKVDETLIEADEIVGMFDEINIVGLARNQDATLTFDYQSDTVTLSLSQAGQGSGAINIVREGESSDVDDDASIWDVLTDGQGTYEELDTSLDVNGEELDEDDILAA